MDSKEIILLAKRELLSGESFLEQYKEPLQKLYNDKAFIAEINAIREKVGNTEFSDISRTKDILKKEFYERKAKYQYPQLGIIADDVKRNDFAVNSAYISVYFAMRMMQNEILLAKGELLTGENFLKQYKESLQKLSQDPAFISEISDIRKKIGDTEFTDIPRTKYIAKKELYDRNAKYRYHPLCVIADDVQQNNFAVNSAYISVYFAMRIFQLNS